MDRPKRKYRSGINEKLKKHLDELIDEYGVIDISMGMEKCYAVSRERLFHVAHEICAQPHRYIHRYREGKKWITVLSCFGKRSTRVVLGRRFNYILGGE